MKRSYWICGFALLVIVYSCKKDKSPVPGNPAKCAIKSETNDLIGNEAYWEYTFNDKKHPSVIKQFNRFGTLQGTTNVGQTDVSFRYPSGDESYFAYNANIHTGMPTELNISSTNSNGISTRNHTTYTFFYDSKKRLIKVGEKTNNIINDDEWNMLITYNDKDNVTSLSYEFTTGPRSTVTLTTVAAYDNKLSPYAAIASWKFLNIHFGWNNYDPQLIITALSRNNPLDFTFGAVPNQWKRAIAYTYNSDGFPIGITNSQTSPSGSIGIFPQTFAYSCQ